MKPTVKVEGLSELNEAFAELGVATHAKALRGSLREGVKPIAEEARRLVKRGDSPAGLHLADAIAVSAPKPTGERGAVAGIKMLSKNVEIADDELEAAAGRGLRFRLPGWRWHLLEFGTRDQPAQPFLRPAFDARAGQALLTFVDSLKKRLERIKKRAALAEAKAAG